MKVAHIYLWSILSSVVLLGGCISNTHHSASLHVGIASVDITPGDRAVLLPLSARAIVFHQGDEKACLVSCDVIAISKETSDQIRQTASEKTGIPFSNIVIVATHNHGGAIHEHFVDKVVESIITAQEQCRPTELFAGTGQEHRVSFNRRFLMKDGTIRFNPGRTDDGVSFDGGFRFLNPDIIKPVGPIDPDIGIAQFKAKGTEQPFGALVNFAMHVCTCTGERYTSEFPTVVEQNLQKHFGSDFISVFGAGACGDINHFDITKPYTQNTQEKQHNEITVPIADNLTETILEKTELTKQTPALKTLSRTTAIPLQTYTQMDLDWANTATANQFKDFPGTDYNQVGFLAGVRARKIIKLAALHEKSSVWNLEVQVIRLSEQTAIVTLPGELFVELGLLIKEQSPFEHTFVIEMANENLLYVPTAKAFGEGSYETVNSFLAPSGGEILTKTAVNLLNKIDF